MKPKQTGPRIYNLFPLLVGDGTACRQALPRVAAMAFDWVYLNPIWYPGFSGSLYAVKDFDRLHPAFDDGSGRSADAQIAALCAAARACGLRVMLDLVINHTAKDALLVERHPEWFELDEQGEPKSPSAIDPANADDVTVWGDLAELDWQARPAREAMTRYFAEHIARWINAGVDGFRCDAAYKVPAAVWTTLIAQARALGGPHSRVVFAAETLGCRLDEVEGLRAAGFDYLFNSVKWWDLEASWLLEQYEQFRDVAPSIGFPESHDTPRWVAELGERGIVDPARVEVAYRRSYAIAATFSTGVLMPVGYEHGWGRRLDVVETRSDHREPPRFDLSPYITAINGMKARVPALNVEGPQRRLAAAPIVALLRRGPGQSFALTLINPDLHFEHALAVGTLDLPPGEAAVEVTPGRPAGRLDASARLVLAPGEVRVFATGVDDENAMGSSAGDAVQRPAADGIAERSGSHPQATTMSRRVVIERVAPEIDGGRYAIKREVGDRLVVEATIFTEGHAHLGAALLVRPASETQMAWQRVPMVPVDGGLDRWRAGVSLEENRRYAYTIEAWRDDFATWRDGTLKKQAAGQVISLALAEGRALVAAALAVARAPEHAGEGAAESDRVSGRERETLRQALARYDAGAVDRPSASDDSERARALLAPAVADAMRHFIDPAARVRYDRTLEVIVDRVAARFAAWYEMFPRSQGQDPTRSATFDDCIRRLPEIAAMGFDVVYLVPIHPIGRVHRKGPDNALTAGPDDPGSPYAIGSAEGGHCAVHAELGTLDDFRRFVAAAASHGMEVALDIAIQAAPDHPWVREHPEWFDFRADGSIQYAENPPKKYQDIVNVQFHGPGREGLWHELLGVFLFWVEQGVKVFRVDNPHTKPVPFWEWCIGEVQRKHPDVIFLSEAFTRPAMMQMLAKVGFTQSYTYFTWRNFKDELRDYLIELTQGEVRQYMRPNFFPTTPDILPRYLQTSGRPGFVIRFVLASTLSSVYGIYNGYELCEAAAVEGKEEYLHSEKYQYKVWDWDRPGHIKDWITSVNRIRRENPALQELLNLRFFESDHEHVLFYGKASHDGRNRVFIAVNLDPFDVHSATLHFPLDEWGVAEGDTFEVEELLTGRRHLWRGARQRVTLDPETTPAVIWRIARWTPVHHRSPCD